jgi:CheY-like chemotaxis protein
MAIHLVSHQRILDPHVRPAHKLVEEHVQPEILVVDDDFSIRETLKMVLEEDGYTVVEMAEGGAALAYLRQHNDPMVVLLDHVMPGMDGAQTLRAVAQDEHLAHTHAYILLTASARNVVSSLLSPLGDLAVAVVAKPFDLDELLNTVARACRELRQREQSV